MSASNQHPELRPETFERANRGAGLSMRETHELAHAIERLRGIEEQLEALEREARRAEALTFAIKAGAADVSRARVDELQEQFETQRAALDWIDKLAGDNEKYHTAFTHIRRRIAAVSNPARCPDCGAGGTEEHGLGCPAGSSPMAGETMRRESAPAKRPS